MINREYFHRPDGIHGVLHAKRVMLICSKLIMYYNLPEDEAMILLYAAMWHDIGRKNDFVDNTHGYQSFQKIEQLKILPQYISSNDKETLKYIIENHPLPDDTGIHNLKHYKIFDPKRAIKLYLLFKDADNLDRCRIGDFNINYLRFDYSRELVNFSKELLTTVI